MSVNALRGHLAEFGIVAAKGIGRVDELIEKAENDATLPAAALAALRVFVQHLEAIDTSVADLDRRIASAHAQNETSRLLAGIPGIGKITASAIVASVPDQRFKSGATFPPGSDQRLSSPSGVGESLAPSPKGQPLYQAALGAGRDVVAERDRQTQRGVARLGRRTSSAQARKARDGGTRQQACPDHMGDHDNGRGLSYRDVREGIEPIAGAEFFKKNSAGSSLASAK